MKQILFVLFIFCAFRGFGQNHTGDCSKFKTGYYTYTEEPYDRFLVKRTSKKQIERGVVSRDKLVTRITWVNECRYDLLMLKTNDPEKRLFVGKNLEVQITSIDGDSYQFESKLLGSTNKGEMVKINKKEFIQKTKKKYAMK